MKCNLGLLLLLSAAFASTSALPFKMCPGDLRFLPFGSSCSCDDDPMEILFCRATPSFPRCRCPPGTVRLGVDRCVLPHQCPKKACPGNLVYSECGSRCTSTCKNRYTTCIRACGPPRCQCPVGTVLLGRNRCVPPEWCPKTCSGDLIFRQCGSMCTPTCETKEMVCPLACAKPRCQCPSGTVLVGKDKCIKPDQCPDLTTPSPRTKCSGDLVYRECGSMCTFTCNYKSMICPRGCTLPRCQCPSGTVLVGKDKCVRPEECINETMTTVTTTTTTLTSSQPVLCSGDLIFRTCGSMCTFTCDTKVMLCPLGCAAPRCQCPGGTVLVGNDKCIRPEECPNRHLGVSVPRGPQ